MLTYFLHVLQVIHVSYFFFIIIDLREKSCQDSALISTVEFTTNLKITSAEEKTNVMVKQFLAQKSLTSY